MRGSVQCACRIWIAVRPCVQSRAGTEARVSRTSAPLTGSFVEQAVQLIADGGQVQPRVSMVMVFVGDRRGPCQRTPPTGRRGATTGALARQAPPRPPFWVQGPPTGPSVEPGSMAVAAVPLGTAWLRRDMTAMAHHDAVGPLHQHAHRLADQALTARSSVSHPDTGFAAHHPLQFSRQGTRAACRQAAAGAVRSSRSSAQPQRLYRRPWRPVGHLAASAQVGRQGLQLAAWPRPARSSSHSPRRSRACPLVTGPEGAQAWAWNPNAGQANKRSLNVTSRSARHARTSARALSATPRAGCRGGQGAFRPQPGLTLSLVAKGRHMYPRPRIAQCRHEHIPSAGPHRSLPWPEPKSICSCCLPAPSRSVPSPAPVPPFRPVAGGCAIPPCCRPIRDACCRCGSCGAPRRSCRGAVHDCACQRTPRPANFPASGRADRYGTYRPAARSAWPYVRSPSSCAMRRLYFHPNRANASICATAVWLTVRISPAHSRARMLLLAARSLRDSSTGCASGVNSSCRQGSI